MIGHYLSSNNKGNVSGANQGSCANPCKPTKKVSKNSEKNHECGSQLTSSIYKIYGQIQLILKVTKKTNFLTTIMVQMHLKFVFFVTSRVRRI